MLAEGAERPRGPASEKGRGMEEEAAAAADVIWPWAEQVMEKGSLTPGEGVGMPSHGKLNRIGTPELTCGGGSWAGRSERVERGGRRQRWATGLRGSSGENR